MDDLDANERNWGMLCHISALAALAITGVGQIVGPFVLWIWKREKYPFVEEQGKESLNFQITMTIVGAAAAVPWYFGLEWGKHLLMTIALIDLAMTAYAAMQASKGIHYRYPFSLKLVN